MHADGQGQGHVEIAVVAAPHSELDLGNEIRMVKAALLYADHVTLVSPNSAIMAMMGGLASMPEPARREVAEALAMRSMTPEQQATLRALRSRKRRRNVEELLILKRFDERLRRFTDDFTLKIAGMVVDAGGNELALGVQQGLVDVDTLGMEDGLGTEEIVQRYTEMLLASVGPSSSTMPLIDDTSGGLLRAFEREKGLPERPGRQPEEAGLAGYMVETLEAFPDATMAEVIDARGVLRTPLVGFRSAMASMARELESAPWDRGFQAEARALYRRDVAQ